MSELSVPSAPLTILFQDAYYVAIDKPASMLVHRSEIAQDEVFVLQTLRRQLRRRVYPVHRLDRPTSGVLLFGLSSEAAQRACQVFENRQVDKRYLAVVRGFTEDAGDIDYPLREEDDGREPQAARTRYRRLATVELPIATGRYATSRYSLVEVMPETGRKHQIRKHFHHIFHPLVGDTTYGEGRHNRLYRETYGVSRLLLIARRLELVHPYTGEGLSLVAPFDDEWGRILEAFGWRAIAQSC